jgi:hypothetical protein
MGAFYERGCQDKYSPTAGRADIVMAASLPSVETIRCSSLCENPIVRHCVVWSPETEKRLAALIADHGSI